MICLLLLMQFVAAAPVPGVNWSKLDVWEGSALADVWARADEYLDFRSYALRALSDLGFLDHLLDLFPLTLRVLSAVGGKTGIACALVTAAAASRARRSSSTSGNEEKEDDDDPRAYTEKDLLTTSFDLVSRMLRDGSVLDVLMGLRDEDQDVNGDGKFNVLTFFYDLDERG